ncbi:MAG TPA: periplasmic heavy metal sensor [Candidatus Udaeobacter sp.]|nr:periplasmic heavy metal sensor [Candidatus Udaeobacter sp.]
MYKLVQIRPVPATMLASIAIAAFTVTLPAQMSTPATGTAQPSSDAALAQQIAELQAKIKKLEATAHSQPPGSPGSMPGMRAGGGMSGMGMQAGGGMSQMGGMQGMENMMGPMEGMDMMGMMSGMEGMQGMNMPRSALPGFPGASHLYHIGATGFFLDRTDHIALSTDQQVALNKIKDQALASKNSAERQIEQDEQELATLTSADQPDTGKIEAKVREIEKLRANERLSFIRSVGEAAKLLTPDQRKILTGFASPAPAASSSPMSDHM